MPNNNDINSFRKLLGKEVPAVPVVNLIDGKEGLLTEYITEGKVILLDFWNTRCLECVDGLDSLEKLIQRDDIKSNVIFIAVNMVDPLEKAKDAITKWTHMKHLWISQESKDKFVVGEFGLKFLPHLVLVDQKGTVIKNGGNFYSDSLTVMKEINTLIEVK